MCDVTLCGHCIFFFGAFSFAKPKPMGLCFMGGGVTAPIPACRVCVLFVCIVCWCSCDGADVGVRSPTLRSGPEAAVSNRA